jgi:sugar phosphate isomerase/epimerase
MDRELVLCDRTLACGSTAAFVRLAAELGFAGVSLRAAAAEPGRAFLAAGSATLREIGAELRASGLFVSEAESIRLRDDAAAADFLPVLDSAAELGARAVLVISEETERARGLANYAALAEAARSRGVRLVLEYMVYRPLPSLAAAAAFVQEADPAGAGVLVDALHFTRAGDELVTLARLGDAVAAVQLCDGPTAAPPFALLKHEALFDRLPPGEGAFDLAGIVQALPPGLPLGIEVLNGAREAAMGARGWARHCRDATRALLARL